MSTFYTSVDGIGNDILFCGYKNGKRIKEKIPYRPTHYVASQNASKFKTLEGTYVEPINPGSIRECRDFLKQYSDVDNFKVYGNTNYVHQFISDAFLERGVEWKRELINVTTLDIEVQSDQGFPAPEKADFPVTAITVKNNIDNIFYVFGAGKWCEEDSILPAEMLEKVVYVDCETESKLLMKFLDHWRANYPDVVTGWNSRLFDTVYLVNRITKVLAEIWLRNYPLGILYKSALFNALLEKSKCLS